MANSAINISANAQEVVNLRKRIDELKAALSSMRRSTDPAAYDKLNRELQTSSVRYNRLVGDIQRYVVAQQQAERATRGTSSSVSEMQKMLLQIGGATAFIALGKQVIDVRAEMQLLETSFGVLLGNEAKANAMLSEIKQYAIESPLSLNGVSKAAQLLLGFNVEAEKVMPTLKQLGDISMGDTGRFQSLSLAFAQMSAAGKLMGQDLLQMINAGFNPLQEISRNTGKSLNELRKEMESGTISSEMVANAFASATSKGGKFYGMTEKQAQGVKGLQAQLEGGLQDAFNEIGKSQEGIIAGGYKMSISLVENYDKVGKALIAIVSAYGAYKASLIAAIALERIRTTVAVYDIATKQIQLGLTLKNIAAQLSLNKVILANPYALAASAIIGLGTAMWAFHDSTTASEKAQAALNNQIEKQTKSNEEERTSIESLISIIKDDTKTRNEKQKALDILQGKYPSIFSNLDIEKIKNLELADAIRQVNEELEKRSGVQSKFNIDRAKEIKDLFKTDPSKARNLANEFLGKSWYNFSSNKDLLDGIDQYIKKANDKLLNDAVTASQAEFNSLPKSNRVDKLKNDVDKLQVQYNRLKVLDKEQRDNPFSSGLSPYTSQMDILESQINTKNSQIKALQEDSSKTSTRDKAYWEKQKKDAESRLSVLSDIAAKGKEGDALRKEILGYDKKLKAYDAKDTSKSAESAAEKRLEAQQWLANKQKELSNDQIKSELEYDQKVLDNQKDSFDKQRKQNELNYRKELLSVKEYEAAKLKEQQEAAKKLYVSQKGSDKGFNFSTFDKSSLPVGLRKEDIDKEVESRNKIANDSYKKSNDDLVKTLTDQYQSYADQRVEIEKKFDKDIASLRSEREKATTKEQKDLLARAEAKAISDRGKGLMSFDFDRLKETPEYVRAFEDLDNTSSETLNSLLKQLQEAKGVASKVLSPDQLREYTSSIQSIIDKLTERNPYTVIIDKKKELADAERELIKAEDQLRRVRSGNGVVTGLVNDEGKLTITYLSEKDAVLEVNKAKDKYNKANNEVFKAQKKIYDQVNELSKALSGLGDNIGGTSGQVISFIGNIGTFATTSMEGIEKVSQKGVLAISTVEKASVILTIISAAIQLMRELESIMPGAFAKYEKYNEKVQQINDMRQAVSDYELAVLKAKQAENSWFGDDSIRDLKNLKDQQNKVYENYFKKAGEAQAIYQNQSGGGWLTKALSSATNWVSKITYGFKVFNDSYKEGTTAAINNLRIETRKKKSGFLGSGIGGKSQKTEDLVSWIKNETGLDLFDDKGMIDVDLAKQILEKQGDKLVGLTKQTLEELIKYREQYDEYLKSLREYVSTMFDPLADNMVQAIWDWFDTGRNALDSFKSYASKTFRDIASDMLKSMIKKNVFGDYEKELATLYDKYFSGDLTEDELTKRVAELTKKVNDRYEKELPIIEKALDATAKSIKDETGIDIRDKTSQKASSGYSTSMSQDTGSAIEGRLTAMQMNLISIDGNVARIAEWSQPFDMKYNVDVLTAPLSALSESCQRIELMLEQNRNIAIQSYYELKDINKQTKELYPMRIDTQAIRKSLESL